MDETRRYKATNLRAILAEQERSASWLARKCSVSQQLMSFILKGERTASHAVASTAAEVLNVPLFLAFDSTEVESSSTGVAA